MEVARPIGTGTRPAPESGTPRTSGLGGEGLARRGCEGPAWEGRRTFHLGTPCGPRRWTPVERAEAREPSCR